METQEPSILDDLNTISKFYNSHRCIEITRELEDSIRNSEPLNRLQFLVDCNLLSTDIDNEISITTKYIRQIYSSKSTNLQSTFKTDPIVSVMIIKSVEAMSANLFPDICKPLPEEKRMVDACDRVLALNSTKQKLDCFVERRMEILAPNPSAFVGPFVAAKLIGNAGGLSELAAMSSVGVRRCVEEAEVCKRTPERSKARFLLALREAAAKDLTRENPSRILDPTNEAEDVQESLMASLISISKPFR